MVFLRRTLLRQTITGICAAWAVPAEARRRHTSHHHHHPHHHHHHHRAHHARALPLVVIDPGHGGKDPGCIGITGVEEKTVVLKLGLELRRQLLRTRRCRVAMTRETDVFVPLERRVAFARKHHATLLISLHANSSKNPHVRGACIYRFAFRASDAEARAQARWENSADRIGGAAFRHASPAVTHILASLMRRETFIHSAWLQHRMVTDMRHHVRLTPKPARHAHFVVLSAPDIPSVLIENGFLTNHVEERQLASRSHRRALAETMRRAVEQNLAHLARVAPVTG